MEILRSDPKEELGVIDEDDEFYEDIEAPKFVDFTAPERYRPDDKSWFCLRIGCDQQHEEVDPDALYRSFMLRVMAARSPNIRYQKALNRQAPRSIKKCPHSAPAKSAKDRVSRLSTITSIPDKMAKSKLKNHPVASLRSTPISTKAKAQPATSEKKALTTPRAKKCPGNHEPFRSVKHEKAPVAVPKNRSVVKALFLGSSPKKNDEASKLLTSEVCDGMKKLNIGTLKKRTPGGHICKAFRCMACNPNCSEVSGKKGEEASSTSLKKRNEVCDGTKKLNIGTLKKHTTGGHICKAFRCKACNPNCSEVSGKKGEEASSMSLKKRNEPREVEISSISGDHSVAETNVEEKLPTSSELIVQEFQQSANTDSTSSNNSEEDSKENRVVVQAPNEAQNQAGATDNVAESDDNKENDLSMRTVNSSTTNSESKRLKFETSDNIPQKVVLQTSSESDSQARVTDYVAKSNDYKENDSSNKENDSSNRNVDSSTTNSERLQQLETSENIPQKVIRAPSKKIQEHGTQAGKIKRTTNPKPFRLRTDERGILKETNLEKKIHLEALKETVPVPKRSDEKQQNAAREKNHETTSNGGQKAQPKPTRVPRVRFVESRYATGIRKCQKTENKESEVSQKKLVKTASSSRQILKTQSVTAARKVQVSQVREKGALDTKTWAEDSKMTNAACSKGRRPSAIPKVSTFQRIHAPKSFSRRPEMTMP